MGGVWGTPKETIRHKEPEPFTGSLALVVYAPVRGYQEFSVCVKSNEADMTLSDVIQRLVKSEGWNENTKSSDFEIHYRNKILRGSDTLSKSKITPSEQFPLVLYRRK